MVAPVIERLNKHHKVIFFTDLCAGLEIIYAVGRLVFPLAVDCVSSRRYNAPFAARLFADLYGRLDSID